MHSGGVAVKEARKAPLPFWPVLSLPCWRLLFIRAVRSFTPQLTNSSKVMTTSVSRNLGQSSTREPRTPIRQVIPSEWSYQSPSSASSSTVSTWETPPKGWRPSMRRIRFGKFKLGKLPRFDFIRQQYVSKRLAYLIEA